MNLIYATYRAGLQKSINRPYASCSLLVGSLARPQWLRRYLTNMLHTGIDSLFMARPI